MSGFLVSGRSGPLSPEEIVSIQAIADALAGSGLRRVPLKDLESAAIENALRACEENRTRAAKLLGISLRTLQRKLRAKHKTVRRSPAEELDLRPPASTVAFP